NWWNGRDLRSNVQRIFFDHFGNTIFVAEQKDELVGFLIGFLSQSNPKKAFIHLVGVRPDARKIGLGSLLYSHFIDACVNHGRTIFRSCTSIENKDSIEFHKRIGFSPVPGDGEIEGVPVSYSYIGKDYPMVLFLKKVGILQFFDQQCISAP
ncbi:MAG: GNAT family N-acetyltransferase, partial [Desulfobacteraceae bacterium]|nr:GNAT family N-acetyltransferase [Desulfobacteraceae bacterium]